MARPQGIAQLNYFPFPEEGLPLFLEHIEPGRRSAEGGPNTTITMLDPCAGLGVAAGAIANHIGCAGPNLHLIELASDRAQRLKEKFPEASILAPNSYLSSAITYHTFSLVYVNPPYQTEIGGGRREEMTFFTRAVSHCTVGGLVVFVLPESQLLGYEQSCHYMRDAIDARLKNVEFYRPPENIREYREVVVFGVKRADMVPPGAGLLSGHPRFWEFGGERMELLGEPKTRYRLIPGSMPKRWFKLTWTPEEIAEKVQASPLAKLLADPEPIPQPSPPMPLGKGHMAILLAAGELDGLIEPTGEDPHVIRGVAIKVSRVDDEKSTEEEDEHGNVTTKTVTIEDAKLTIRAIDTEGNIYNLTDTVDNSEGTKP